MKKVYGDCVPRALRSDGMGVCYCFGGSDAAGGGASWYEIVLMPRGGLGRLSGALLRGVRRRGAARWAECEIREGWAWNGKAVWLSVENQLNYTSALADAEAGLEGALPVRFKLGTDECPEYEEIADLATLRRFCSGMRGHIRSVLDESWRVRDLEDPEIEVWDMDGENVVWPAVESGDGSGDADGDGHEEVAVGESPGGTQESGAL